METNVLEGARYLMATGAAKCIRIAADVSVTDVAKMVGCSTSAVTRWERSGQPGGRVNGTPRLLTRYGKVLEVLAARVRDQFVGWQAGRDENGGPSPAEYRSGGGADDAAA